MIPDFDVAIIGCGPAGMASAAEVRRAGFTCIVLDEQASPGGQIYRRVETARTDRVGILGKDYEAGAGLVREFRACGALYVPGASVWNVTRQRSITYSLAGRSTTLTAGAIVVASGAIERPTPMPGWTMPGVMTAGACQILLKAHGLVDDDVVFVGSGPLLWLIASQMVGAGVAPKAIVETVPRSRYVTAARRLPLNPAVMKYLLKGVSMMRAVKRAGVPVHRGASDIRIVGVDRAEGVTFLAGGMQHRLEASLVALHQGVVPNQQISRLIRCEHQWSETQRCFVPVLSGSGETSVGNVYVAGDGGGIGGARVAELQGRAVGACIAERLGGGRPKVANHLRAALASELAVRPFLETLYAPPVDISTPADDTVVCRCEEITAGEIRRAVRLGMAGPNQVKSFLRNGMGPCQGRMCGLAVTEIVAAERGVSQSDVEYYRVRPPLKPLALAELAVFGRADIDHKAAE